MIDWTASMQQTFEYYIVDPGTWKDVKLINDVKSCKINFIILFLFLINLIFIIAYLSEMSILFRTKVLKYSRQ